MASVRVWFVMASAVLSMCATSEANACWISPPPPPPAIEVGETEQAFAVRLTEWKRHQETVKQREAAEQQQRELRREAGLWEAASQIFVVEVVAAGFVKPQGSKDRWAGMPQVTLRVTQIVKGLAIRRRPFKLRYEDAQWCMMGPAAEVVRGQVGEKFVVFAKNGELGMETVIGGYGIKTARDNRTRYLLGLPEMPDMPLQINGAVDGISGKNAGKFRKN
jgi:hypothetical protein